MGGRVWMRGSGQVYVRVCKGVGVAKYILYVCIYICVCIYIYVCMCENEREREKYKMRRKGKTKERKEDKKRNEIEIKNLRKCKILEVFCNHLCEGK